MSNPDDRFIAYVCDKGALPLDDIANRIGDTPEKAARILEWIECWGTLQKQRYAALVRDPDGAVMVTSNPGWRQKYLVRKGFILPEHIDLTNQHGRAHQAHPSELLTTFLGGVKGALEKTSEDMLRYVWRSYVGSGGRTAFYHHGLWPRVARSWNPPLFLDPEYRRFDHAFLDPSIGHVLILAESENNSPDISGKELTDLCRFHAPLSVIATCMEWHGHPEIPDRLKQGRQNREAYSGAWQARIKTLCEGARDERRFCFIVAEGYPETEDDVTPETGVYFRFNALAFNTAGEMLGEDICLPLLHERRLQWQPSPTTYFLSAIPIG